MPTCVRFIATTITSGQMSVAGCHTIALHAKMEGQIYFQSTSILPTARHSISAA